ncbi:MAG: GxxExxY protein [Candidatus Poribacteria bacterium]
MNELIHKELTGQIIGSAFEVFTVLGYGFLEKVYENALIKELQIRGLQVKAQYPIKVKYKGEELGEYYADIFVENKVIIEIKTGESFNSIHEAQLLNYLKATECKVGLLINFGPKKCEYKRFVF